PEKPVGRCICALPQDQEFSLAHARQPFPRLSSSARRARRPDLRHDRRDCGTGKENRRTHSAPSAKLRGIRDSATTTSTRCAPTTCLRNSAEITSNSLFGCTPLTPFATASAISPQPV